MLSMRHLLTTHTCKLFTTNTVTSTVCCYHRAFIHTAREGQQGKMAASVPNMSLPGGYKMPMHGLGCFFGDKPDDAEVTRVVKLAIDVGYRLLDCALIYGTEKAVGQGIAEKIAEGVIKREDLFITTKLPPSDALPQHVRPALEMSLKNLQTDYVDIYLIHQPFVMKKPEGHGGAVLSDGVELNNDNDHLRTWHALEECVDQGLTRSIGISNFNSKQVQRILDNCRIPPANNQVEIHPYFSNAPLVEYCQTRGVTITAYTPLGQPHSSWAKEGWVSPLKNPVIEEIAKKHGKGAGQVALRYQTQRNIAICAKSSSEKRLRENLEIFDFTLDADDMKAISNLNRNDRINNFFPAKEHKDWPFNEPF